MLVGFVTDSIVCRRVSGFRRNSKLQGQDTYLQRSFKDAPLSWKEVGRGNGAMHASEVLHMNLVLVSPDPYSN